ncbi:MAG: endo-1,4-beta-xylanase [Kiritimatiellae bacterium]|nr:endo-1,4-beta-xylanase [Kiritimatiellia bacterium]
MKTAKSAFKFKGGVHPDCNKELARDKAIVRLFVTACVLPLASAFAGFRMDRSVMSDAYWQVWNDAEQARIDTDIEANRKADASVGIAAPDGMEVRVEQLSHAFRFGAHAFAVGRLPTQEANRRYEECFSRLFNQATIAFYWRGFETAPGDCHFHTRAGDLESAFTSGERDRMDPHSRYLSSPVRSTDQFIEFAKHHGMVIHGHPLVWGSEEWMIPFWLYEQYCPESEKVFLRLPRKDPRTITRLYGEKDWVEAWKKRIRELYAQYSEEEIAARCPTYIVNMKRLYAKRIAEILDYCGDRVDSWDVVNESVNDWRLHETCRSGKPVTKSHYGLLPPDYTLESFLTAAKHVSAVPKLAINDNQNHEEYRRQIDDLVAHGARIDMVGWQFHIFRDADFDRIVAGEKIGWPFCSTPEDFRKIFGTLGGSGRPVSISEITLPSPGRTEKSMMQQAIVARNYYRLWFSQPSCCGITWWHTLDGANKSGGIENGTAGLMDAGANPKPSYWALDDLINRQWRTRQTAVAMNGKITFRGFRGRYRLSWTDPNGKSAEKFFELR